MNDEERALWDRIVAAYVESDHARLLFNTTSNRITGSDVERTVAAVRSMTNFGSCLADAAVDERRKRFTAEPADNWRGAKFRVTVGQCCYCDATEVRRYQRGNVMFGCEKCTGLAPDADAKLPGGS